MLQKCSIMLPIMLMNSLIITFAHFSSTWSHVYGTPDGFWSIWWWNWLNRVYWRRIRWSWTAPTPRGPAWASVTSILDRLRPPLRSELYRKRELEKPVTNNKKHKAGVANTIDPNTVTLATRVKEFPGKSLVVKSKQLSNYTDTLSCQHRPTTTSSEEYMSLNPNERGFLKLHHSDKAKAVKVVVVLVRIFCKLFYEHYKGREDFSHFLASWYKSRSRQFSMWQPINLRVMYSLFKSKIPQLEVLCLWPPESLKCSISSAIGWSACWSFFPFTRKLNTFTKSLSHFYCDSYEAIIYLKHIQLVTTPQN